jgi:hypothetical protein
MNSVTTVSTIQLDPSTVANSDPSGTPTLSFPLTYKLQPVQTAVTTRLQAPIQARQADNGGVAQLVLNAQIPVDEANDDGSDLGSVIEEGQPNKCEGFE